MMGILLGNPLNISYVFYCFLVILLKLFYIMSPQPWLFTSSNGNKLNNNIQGVQRKVGAWMRLFYLLVQFLDNILNSLF